MAKLQTLQDVPTKVDAKSIVNNNGVLKVSNSFIREMSNFVSVKDFGAKGDGVTDDTAAIQSAIDSAKSTRVLVVFDAGTYLISDTLEVNGVSLEGAYVGYFNRQGTTIKGDGTFDIIKQTTYSTSDITHSIKNIRVTNGLTGFNLGYVVNSIYENIFVENCVDGFRLGRGDLSGPLFNNIINLNCRDITQYGVVLGGDEWSNNNYFQQGFWDATDAAFYQESVGGAGSINNTIDSVELGGSGSNLGVVLNGIVSSMTIRDCYFEPQGTSVTCNGPTRDLVLDGNLYSGHFNFADEGAILISKLISTININGGHIYHGNESNKNFTFLHADFDDTEDRRNNYTFVTEPYYENPISSTLYEGVATFIPPNFKTKYTSNNITSSRIDLVRDTNIESNVGSAKAVYHKSFDTLSNWTNIAQVTDAHIQFGYSVCHFKVDFAARNTSDNYLLGATLDVVSSCDQTSLSVREKDFTVYGGGHLEYQVIASGDDVLLQMRSNDTLDDIDMLVDVNAAGKYIDEIV